MKMDNNNFKSLPQIEIILNNPGLEKWFPELSRPLVAKIASAVIGYYRDKIKSGGKTPLNEEVIKEIDKQCNIYSCLKMQNIINATGIILHTNMGRAPIHKNVWEKAACVNTGYSNLEFNLKTGKRGQRNGIIPVLLKLLIHAESSIVVNNNAAAVFLLLSTFAKGKEVIVSRGEQIQIGGGFRIPDILSVSGAKLIEVGTTNVTTIKDYTDSITHETAMILTVHSSNFKIRGFTKRPSIEELAKNIPDSVILAVDQGSGTTIENITGEIKARSYLSNGADVICFSGDKILGGPQAGIIAGKERLIKSILKNQLYRIVRPGKTIYSLMEESLIQKLNKEITGQAQRVLTIPESELKKRGRRILRDIPKSSASITASTISTGGGSSPDETYPSLSIKLNSEINPEKLLSRLRNFTPPVIGIISGGAVLLNLATIDDAEVPHVKSALNHLFSRGN